MAGSNITIEILKDIRRDVRDTKTQVDSIDKRVTSIDERLELTSQRLDITNERLGIVESTLLTLARRQRTAIKYVKAVADHVLRLDGRVTNLESR
jgi:hypothetical protein